MTLLWESFRVRRLQRASYCCFTDDRRGAAQDGFDGGNGRLGSVF